MMMIINSTPSMGEEVVRIDSKRMWCGEKLNQKGHTHALATDDICQPTEEELPNEGTDGGGDLETKILIRGGLLTGTIDIADHDGSNVNGEDVIAKEGIMRFE